jgi:hypothetical protein
MSMRGGFRAVVKGATGDAATGASTRRPLQRWGSRLLTIALLVAAAVLLLRRFGAFG